MDSKEASKVFKERNKARKLVKQCEKALWSGKVADFSSNQKRLKLAQDNFTSVSVKFTESLKVTLC